METMPKLTLNIPDEAIDRIAEAIAKQSGITIEDKKSNLSHIKFFLVGILARLLEKKEEVIYK